MFKLADLAMHDLFGTDNIAAKGRPDCLMPKADPKNRDLPRKVFDQINADSSLLWSAWAGRDQDMIGLSLFDFFRSDLVIAAHLDLLPQFAQVLHQVVSERIVVVEDEDHAKTRTQFSRQPRPYFVRSSSNTAAKGSENCCRKSFSSTRSAGADTSRIPVSSWISTSFRLG